MNDLESLLSSVAGNLARELSLIADVCRIFRDELFTLDLSPHREKYAGSCVFFKADPDWFIREGYDSLVEADELEEDYLDKAWGLEPESRLSCQALVADEDLVIEIPKYTINHARE